MVDHAGHGMNFYAYTHQLVVDQLVFIAQVPRRGALVDPALSQFGWALIADLAARLHELVRASDDLAPDERLVVAWSGFRGITAAGVVSVYAAVGEKAFHGKCDLDSPQEWL